MHDNNTQHRERQTHLSWPCTVPEEQKREKGRNGCRRDHQWEKEKGVKIDSLALAYIDPTTLFLVFKAERDDCDKAHSAIVLIIPSASPSLSLREKGCKQSN
jgi:hypothetical protein